MENPRLFMKGSPAARGRASCSMRALRRRLKIVRFPPSVQDRMSTTATSGIGRSSIRVGSSITSYSPDSTLLYVSRDGVAEPSTTVAPARSALNTATSRA